MAQLERERELAVMEQEMMERLKAEELLFQQVRQESSVLIGTSGVTLGVVQPRCWKTHLLCLDVAFLYLPLYVCMWLLYWRRSSDEVGGKPRESAVTEAKGTASQWDLSGQPCLWLVEWEQNCQISFKATGDLGGSTECGVG